MLACLAFLVLMAAAAASVCPSTWQQVADQCFWASDYSVPWQSVLPSCQAVAPESQPASVHDLIENSVIASLLEGQESWLGLSRSSVDSNFTWSDGSPVNFTYWQEGQPHNDGNCILINGDSVTGQWDTEYCHEDHMFVCQQPASTCPQGWSLYDNVCYLYNTTNIYGNQLPSACQGSHHRAQPVSIHGAAVNTFLASLQTSWTYIGLWRDHVGGSFMWYDGSSYDYNNFSSSQGTYCYVQLARGGNWQWFNDSYPFFCQISI